MYCTNCGAPNSDQAAFCTTCGATLNAPEEQKPQQQQEPQKQQPAPPPQQQPPQQPQQYAQQQYEQPPQQPYQGQAYPPQGYPQQPAYGYPQQAPPKKKKTGLIIGIVAGVVVLAIVLALVLSSGGGGGGKSGLTGKWTVSSAEYSSDYEEGLIFNFKSNGTLVFEAPKGTPDEMKGFYELMNMMKTKYKTAGDKLILTVEFFGEKDTTEIQFKIEGDTLTFYESGSLDTVLKRTK